MTSQPLPGSVQQTKGVTQIPLGFLVLLLLTFLVPLWGLYQSYVTVSGIMLEKGWGKTLSADSNLSFLVQCSINTICSNTIQSSISKFFPIWTWAAPALGFVAYALGAKPKTYATRDPGTVWWAMRNDKGTEQYTSNDPRRKENTLHGYLGHLLTVEKTGEIAYNKTIPLYVRMAALSENVLILGGVGAGKTRGYFRPLLMLGATLGYSVIVFDLKYPQTDSGFFDMVGFWKKAGKRVMMFTPFSDNTMRLPLLESVEDYASALSMSATVMPPPEYGPEPGKHYRDRDRGVLAAFILAVAQSDNPSLAELLKMAQYTPKEMQEWFEKQVAIDEDSEIVQNLKGVFGQGDKEVASVLQGIKNALRIFYNPKVARATTSKEGENMDIRAAFRSPTMIYVGIQQEYMMEGDVVVLLQLVKRYIDKQLQREAEFQGGSLKRHVAYVMDEFPSFGQLPYMMRSLGVLRSYNVSHHIGVQNLKQLAVVYGDNYSEALTTNVIGRKIFFPQAVEGDEKKIFSEALGMTTVYDISEGDSRRAFLGSTLDEGTRQTMNFKQVAVPLLPPEQFAHFRPMEAVVMGRGSNPMRVFMPAIEDEFLDGPEFPTGKNQIRNYLATFYNQVNPERENMGRYTQKIVASGELGTSIKGESSDKTGKNDLASTDTEATFADWISAVLDTGARVRLAGENQDRIYLRISKLPEELIPDTMMRGNFTRGWTAKYGNEEIRLTNSGLEILADELRLRVEQQAVFGAVLEWMDANALLIEGTPEREAVPEDKRMLPAAVLNGTTLALGKIPLRDMFGHVRPKFRRIKTREYFDIDLEDPIGFARKIAALRQEMRERAEHGDPEPDEEMPGTEAGANQTLEVTLQKASTQGRATASAQDMTQEEVQDAGPGPSPAVTLPAPPPRPGQEAAKARATEEDEDQPFTTKSKTQAKVRSWQDATIENNLPFMQPQNITKTPVKDDLSLPEESFSLAEPEEE